MTKGENYFKGVELSTNLIVLDSKGTDVILGMDWMSKQKALRDCAEKAVKLTTEVNQEKEYMAKPLITHKGVTNQIKCNQLGAKQNKDILVVNEYPDVFPEELPGMSPDRYIEFIIELLPDTAPIYKRTYMMSTQQLEELKEPGSPFGGESQPG
jgi:nitrogen regulatory protein PII-like uncharacterized protein